MRLACQYSRGKVTNSSSPSLPELIASDPEGHQGSGGDVGGAGEGLHQLPQQPGAVSDTCVRGGVHEWVGGGIGMVEPPLMWTPTVMHGVCVSLLLWKKEDGFRNKSNTIMSSWRCTVMYGVLADRWIQMWGRDTH